jgi:biotin synthase
MAGMAIKAKNHITTEGIVTALHSNNFQREVLKASLLLRDQDQALLFQLARTLRDARIPTKKVEVRSVIEISNICRQGCLYCNMGRNQRRELYIITLPDFITLVEHIYSQARRVLLIQSGENPSKAFVDHVCRCVKEIKKRFNDLVIILCLGNLSYNQYLKLKESGADRYILKFETSNPNHYAKMKPFDTLEKRLRCLEHLIAIGFQVGTGSIVGLPGQTLDDIVNDLLLIKKYKVMMASCTAFIPGEQSKFKDEPIGDIDLTLNALALLRIMNPHSLIPTTSSLEKVRTGGQYLGLMAGANTVTIHDGTPEKIKALFPIYSVTRFTPNRAHLESVVKQAGLSI